MQKIKYIYVGWDPETPLILSKDKNFELVAVSLIESFFAKTINPVNFIFKAVYSLRRMEKLRWLEFLLSLKWELFKSLSSSIFFVYRDYLALISEKKVNILDFADNEKVGKYIRDNDVDLIVVNTWDLLSKNIVELPKYGTINIHPSELPKYRGALPTLWALKNGDKKTAVTYMLLDNSMDGGKIISQHIFPISSSDDAISLESKIKEIIEKTLAQDISGYLDGKIIPLKQIGEATFTAKYEDYKKIDWQNENGRDIYNKIKLYPYLGHAEYCYIMLNDKKVLIKDAEFIPDAKIFENATAGQFRKSFLNILFQAKDGIIKTIPLELNCH